MQSPEILLWGQNVLFSWGSSDNQNCFHFHFNEAGNAEADTVSFNSEVSDFAGA